MKKIVSIGGGTGQPVLLKGLKKFTSDITAIVGVQDNGGSSGVLRRELKVLPPGDIRNCLIALSKDEEIMHKLFQYRFEEGPLKNHAMGNLFLVALSKIMGGFEEAIAETGKILKINGQVLPASLDEGHICAELEDGTIIKTEPVIESHGSARVKKLYIEPEAKTTEEVKKTISEADIVVLGPGSLYTSILPNLLVKGLAKAIRDSDAKVVYVCNIFTQPGETEGLMASDLVNEIEKYLGKDVLDVVLVNNQVPPKEVLKRYEADGAELVTGDITGVKVIAKNFLPDHGTNPLIWAQKDWLRHDPDKLAQVIKEL